jgi:hypothetical protein
MNKAACIFTFAAGFLLMGCSQSALLRTLHENTEAEKRIAIKQQELKAQEEQRAALLREQKNLLAELDTKQMTFKELNAKLANLRKKNDQIRADTEAQRKQKESLELQLRTMQDISKRYQKEISDFESNERFSENEKKKTIAELRKQMNAHFQLLLKS